MKGEICCIINKEKPSNNEWKYDDSDFLELYTVYIKKLGQFFFILARKFVY